MSSQTKGSFTPGRGFPPGAELTAAEKTLCTWGGVRGPRRELVGARRLLKTTAGVSSDGLRCFSGASHRNVVSSISRHFNCMTKDTSEVGRASLLYKNTCLRVHMAFLFHHLIFLSKTVKKTHSLESM